MKRFDAFTEGFIECLLWSETIIDEDGNDQGNFDDAYSVDDIDPAGLEEIIRDCADFLEANRADIDACDSDAQAGHDFCLTRNGHGAGFWDRGLEDVGERLTDASKPYGTIGLYIGDDGRVYVHN